MLLHPRAWYMVVLNAGTAEPHDYNKGGQPCKPWAHGLCAKDKICRGHGGPGTKAANPAPLIATAAGRY